LVVPSFPREKSIIALLAMSREKGKEALISMIG
jgi:hypothetical protein